jgi:hypothetical protein
VSFRLVDSSRAWILAPFRSRLSLALDKILPPPRTLSRAHSVLVYCLLLTKTSLLSSTWRISVCIARQKPNQTTAETPTPTGETRVNVSFI